MSKFRIVAIGASAAVLLTLGLTTSAMASVTGGEPNPSPSDSSTCSPDTSPSWSPTGGTVSPEFGFNPCPTPTQPVAPKCPLVLFPVPQPAPAGADLSACRVRQQELDIDVNSVNPLGTVLGTGPIRFHFGTDTTLSPTRDRLSDAFGDSVVIHHAALSGATVDFDTCTILLTQQDLPWWIRGGGTGIYRNAIAAGLYDLQGLFSFPTRNFKCTLPSTLTAWQAAWDLNHNGIGLPQPLMFDIAVQAEGWATTQPVVKHFEFPTA